MKFQCNALLFAVAGLLALHRPDDAS